MTSTASESMSGDPAGRLAALERFAGDYVGGDDFDLAPASEDASFRRYFRLRAGGDRFIIMDAPPEHEASGPFLEVAAQLAAAGLHPPRVYEVDKAQGFMVLEDLGDGLYLDRLTEANARHLYGAAIDALVVMQTELAHEDLSEFVHTCFEHEFALFTDWLLQRHLGLDPRRWQSSLDATAATLKDTLQAQPRVFVHRDYHSRNLIWLEAGAAKTVNPGILDFQDAVSGPLAYDLVSLLRDCYVAWPPALIDELVLRYLERLARAAAPFEVPDAATFRRWFDLTGIQRHLKAAGIFARLAHRDSKPRYLADLPRTLGYVARVSSAYPELTDLRTLVAQTVLPAVTATAQTTRGD